ncbi:MAG: flagellar hook-basal body complex protein FliE [Epsilonproteobacteria bacterium]|nr:MAG: flagellar hook-basal body complex protein FliE [Campylobacterota bacterium]RLA66133.1 MAG: flagellar hook-basal body complex protein FliE [Campylobacterota bacterium]
MPIETKAAMSNILKNVDGNTWVKKAKIEPSKAFRELQVPSGEGKSFGEVLGHYIGEVNDLQGQANKAIEKLVTGKSKNIHETMLAVEKAEIAFKTMNQIRLKVIDAYREIMKMQV